MMKKMSDERKRITSNFFSLTILQAANYILPLIILPFLVRVLGLDKFGLVMYAQSLATILLIAVDFGFEISGTREVAISRNNKEELSQIFSAILTIKFVLIVFWFIILFILVEFIPKFKVNALIYYLSFGVVIGQAIFPVWFFQGIEKMKFVTLINILAKFIFTLLIFLIIRGESDYYLVPIFNSIGFIVAGLIGLILAFNHINFVKPPKKLIKRLFKDSISLFIGKFSTNLYTNCNVLILGFFAGDIIVGVYSSIEKLLLAVKNVYIPFYQALFPWLSKQENKKRILILKKIAPFVLTTGIIITSIILIFGDRILMIIYNDNILNDYINIFKILSFLAIVSGLNMMFLSLYFPSVKMYKERMNIFLTAGFFHIILSFILVKFYNIYGTAMAVLATEFLLLILGFYSFKRHLNK